MYTFIVSEITKDKLVHVYSFPKPKQDCTFTFDSFKEAWEFMKTIEEIHDLELYEGDIKWSENGADFSKL